MWGYGPCDVAAYAVDAEGRDLDGFHCWLASVGREQLLCRVDQLKRRSTPVVIQ